MCLIWGLVSYSSTEDLRKHGNPKLTHSHRSSSCSSERIRNEQLYADMESIDGWVFIQRAENSSPSAAVVTRGWRAS